MIIQTENLGWTMRGHKIIQDVTIHVNEGEIFGLIGPNGSGKSSLLKLISGILKPSTGSVKLLNISLSKMNRRRIAQNIAIVEQNSHTSDNLCVNDVVQLGRTPWLTALRPWNKTDDLIVQKAIECVEINEIKKRLWPTLSGGESQRVQLARALAQDPKVLLLDEPTNHLDIYHQLIFLELIKKISMTTLLAIHDLNHVQICDRIGVMENGHLVATGKPHDILKPDLIKKVFGVDMHVLNNPMNGNRVIDFNL